MPTTKKRTQADLRESVLQRRLAEMVQRKTGLDVCPPDKNCRFCEEYGDTPATMMQFRNFYLAGVPTELFGKLLDPYCPVEPIHIEKHAIYQGWKPMRRQIKMTLLTKEMTNMLVLQRLANSMGTVAPNSGDKMIQLMAQMTGAVGKETQPNEVNVNISWEQTISQNGKGGKEAVISLDENDFEEITEADKLLVEGTNE